MKRLVTMMLVVAFTFAMAAQASAIEVNVKGNFHFSFRWADNFGAGKFNKQAEEETFLARQRVRLQVEFIANENLKGVLFLHSNMINWGDANSGGQLDTNKNTLTTRFAYIDWNVADTNLNVKMGLQNVINPSFAAGAVVFHDSMAGITLSNKFNDNFTGSLGWYRLSDNGSAKKIKDSFDMFLLMLPLTFDSVKITPWGEVSLIGRDTVLGEALLPAGNSYFEKKATMYHAGLSAEINPIDPLKIMGDFIYGGVNAGGNSTETDGFYAALKATYNLGFGQLAAGLWYTSGNDRKDLEKKDFSNMPTLAFTTNGDPGFNFSSLGFWGNQALAGAVQVSGSGVGTAGIMVGLEQFSFVSDLSHTARVLWYTGTNDKDLRDDNGNWISGISGVNGAGGLFMARSGVLMTEKDNAFELNLDSRYQIAKGFTATLDLGVLFMDWQGKYERAYDLDDTMWRIHVGLQYAF